MPNTLAQFGAQTLPWKPPQPDNDPSRHNHTTAQLNSTVSAAPPPQLTEKRLWKETGYYPADQLRPEIPPPSGFALSVECDNRVTEMTRLESGMPAFLAMHPAATLPEAGLIRY